MAEIYWSRMKASEINALAKRDTVVIVPVASMSSTVRICRLKVDCLLVGAIAERAARRAQASIPVIVTPTVWSGLAEHHMSLGATLSLDYSAFFALLRGVCRSVVRDGFKRILLLNGHGGNIAALTVAVNESAQNWVCRWRPRLIGFLPKRPSARSSKSKPMSDTPARQKPQWCSPWRQSSSTCHSRLMP